MGLDSKGAEVSNQPTAPSTPRHPFSLRELFCLTTMAGVTLALVLSSAWTNHERWLLGLTLGGSLLGITVARACQRQGWLIGILAGTIGGLIAMVIIGKEWLTILNERATSGSWAAVSIVEFRNDYLWAAATTAGLGVLLALLGVACFHLLVWTTDAGEQGLFPSARRHPYRACAVAMLFAALVIGAFNIDFLLAPQAWAPRHFIPLAHMERPFAFSHGVMDVRTGTLSCQGELLIVEKYVSGINDPITKSEVYRLDPRPQIVPSLKLPERASFVTFDCTQNRIAYLEWQRETHEGYSVKTHRLRIMDLDRHTSETLNEKPRTGEVHSLEWLPNGALVIHYGDSWNGKEGHTLLQPYKESEQWSRQESDVVAKFNPRSGTTLEFREAGMRIVDLKSSREIASFSQPWVDEMMEFLGGDPSSCIELSPDARFILAGSKIYDRESKTIRNWHVKDGFPMPFFHAFTPGGHALLDDSSNFRAWHPWMFLRDVPLGSRLLGWLMRESVLLIDPATGWEVARTRPLHHESTSITLSHDGSRMAVFTDDGVYVYDVPGKFR